MTDDHIQLGTIEFDTGFVNLVAVYRAICFRPFVNEVLDAAVSHVTELGFFAEVGPLEVFVSRLVRYFLPSMLLVMNHIDPREVMFVDKYSFNLKQLSRDKVANAIALSASSRTAFGGQISCGDDHRQWRDLFCRNVMR